MPNKNLNVHWLSVLRTQQHSQIEKIDGKHLDDVKKEIIINFTKDITSILTLPN